MFKKYKLHHKSERVFCVSEIKLDCFQPATVLVAMAADGTLLPPFVVFPGVRLNLSAVRDAFPGAAFTSTYDGQINEDVFLWWFRDHFLKHVPSVGRKPSVLFLSRWVVDVTLQLAQKAKEEKVYHVNKLTKHLLPDSMSSMLFYISRQWTIGNLLVLPNLWWSGCS